MTSIFYAPPKSPAEAEAVARELLERARRIPPRVRLLVSAPPLAVELGTLTPERLLALVPLGRIHAARGIVDLVALLGSEARSGDYFLEALLAETEKLPAFTALRDDQFAAYQLLLDKGCRFEALPSIATEAAEALLKISQEFGISLEYLLGNLDKTIRVITRLGVRAISINVSNAFHNALSGFALELELGNAAAPSQKLLERAVGLEANGVAFTLFRDGHFSARLAQIAEQELDEIVADVEESYHVAEGTFRGFIDASLAAEEVRVAAAPSLDIRELLACFRFPDSEREAVESPGVISRDDPSRWRETDLGQALLCLHGSLNWLAFSTGIKAAGDLETLRADPSIGTRIDRLGSLAAGYAITLRSGRAGRPVEARVDALQRDAVLFDLYCLAVLEKRPLFDVLEVACGILELIRQLENHDPIVSLDALVSSRLAGESYATLLGTQGLVLRNVPIVDALERLRALGSKVELTVRCVNEAVLPIDKVSVDEFRRAVILMGRQLRELHTPEGVLAVIADKIVPEILRLPVQVIAQGPHDLSHLVDFAFAGVPARYALRRPWKKLDLDQLVNLGTGLEPGIRNCLGCPVNNLYGLVTKTARGLGFDEIITYEATGCFEVYSGIWPYTGKQLPSLHGVFGGAASEMLGGMAAKRARARHAARNGNGGTHGSSQLADRILHLGWGGDGATFDIGFGNLSGLFSRLQKIAGEDAAATPLQRALYVCYDNEGYQNTGNQYSAATAPGGNTTTNPSGLERALGNDLRKKPMVEIVAEHGVPLSARMNIHRQEHISRVVARALEDGDRGSFLHFLQPCTTGWKFTADSLTYDLSYLAEDGGLFPPVTIEHGVAFLEIYPTRRDPEASFMNLQARFKHLLGKSAGSRESLAHVLAYYRSEWERNLRLGGFEGEIPYVDRLGYLEEEHRSPRVS